MRGQGLAWTPELARGLCGLERRARRSVIHVRPFQGTHESLTGAVGIRRRGHPARPEETVDGPAPHRDSRAAAPRITLAIHAHLVRGAHWTRSTILASRYPLTYPDQPAVIEYVWPIPARNWQEALELIDDEVSLGGIKCVDSGTRVVDRLVLIDGYDFGSEERRSALARLCRLLCPHPIARRIWGLGATVAHDDS